MTFVKFYILFTYLDLKDLSSCSYIKTKSQILYDFKENNLILFSLIFFVGSIIWILLLGFASPLAILSGFIFGQWYGTLISVFTTKPSLVSMSLYLSRETSRPRTLFTFSISISNLVSLKFVGLL